MSSTSVLDNKTCLLKLCLGMQPHAIPHATSSLVLIIIYGADGGCCVAREGKSRHRTVCGGFYYWRQGSCSPRPRVIVNWKALACLHLRHVCSTVCRGMRCVVFHPRQHTRVVFVHPPFKSESRWHILPLTILIKNGLKRNKTKNAWHFAQFIVCNYSQFLWRASSISIMKKMIHSIFWLLMVYFF